MHYTFITTNDFETFDVQQNGLVFNLDPYVVFCMCMVFPIVLQYSTRYSIPFAVCENRKRNGMEVKSIFQRLTVENLCVDKAHCYYLQNNDTAEQTTHTYKQCHIMLGCCCCCFCLCSCIQCRRYDTIEIGQDMSIQIFTIYSQVFCV